MRERHHRTDSKHPKTCTCTTCQAHRIETARPKVKKKRKPKSQRGKDSKKQVAESIREFHAAGVRHLVVDFIAERSDQLKQIDYFGEAVMPLLADLITR